MALLGAIILDNRAFERVADFLKPNHFVTIENEKIFALCVALIENGKVADPVTLKDACEQEEAIKLAGGAEYITRLVACAATAFNAGDYGRVVYDLYLRRELIALGENVVNTAYAGDASETADKQVEKAETSLYELAGEKSSGGFEFAHDSVDAVFRASCESLRRRKEGVETGIRTGLADLDRIMGPLRGGQLVILGGRPSMGKSTVAGNITLNVAGDYSYRRASDKDGKIEVLAGGRPLFMSFETDREMFIAQNLQVRLTGLSGASLMNPDPKHVSGADIIAAGRKARQDLARMPIAVMDRVMSISGIRTAVRRWKRKHGAELLIVDHLGLIEPTNKRASLYETITEASRSLKVLAKELDIPIIALCQLSRKVDERENKRPIKSDLRESGHLEQDADIIVFVYREHYYLMENPPMDDASQADVQKWQRRCEETATKMELIVAKNRFGPTGTAIVHYEAGRALVANAERGRF